jgi:hypothetical protein
MTIERARELLGDLVVDLSDEEVQEIMIDWQRFANTIIDLAERNLSNEDIT